MIKHLLVLLFILRAILSSAQTVVIKDKDTGMNLEFVTLSSQTPRAHTLTNSSGQADLTPFKDAEKIEIRLMGYKTLFLSYNDIRLSNFKLQLESKLFSLDETVVSATRWSQLKQDVPAHITTVSAKEIINFQPQSTADLLGSSGEVFIQKSQQGGGSPMIRGFSTNRLLYSVDGVRMNNAIFRGGNIQSVISLDAFAIENTEVLYGPGSVIYGSDAIGGAMIFKTLTPKYSLSDEPFITGSANVRGSSANNERTGHFHVNVGWKKWASLTSLSHNDFSDLRMGKNGPDEYLRNLYVIRMDSVDRIVENPDPLVQTPTGYGQTNLMQKLSFRPNSNWEFTYGFHYSETTPYSRYDRLIELSNGLPRSAVWNYGPQIWRMNVLGASSSKKTFAYDELNMRIANQYFQESRIDRNFSGGNRFRLRTQLEEVIAISTNVDMVKSLSRGELFYGVEAVGNEVKSDGSAIDIRDGSPIDVADRYPQSNWASYGVYINYHHKLTETIIVQVGARYNHFTVKSDFTSNQDFFPMEDATTSLADGALVGNVGLVINPSEYTSIRTNFSTGFRAPNVDDMGKLFDLPEQTVVVPNPDLSSEYAYNFEAGMSQIFGNSVRLDFGAFYTYLNNAMVRRDYQVNGQDSIEYNGEISRVQAIQNAAYGYVYGGFIELEVKVISGFSLLSRFNYQRGFEEMDNGDLSPSRHAAPAFGLAALKYQFQKLNMQLYTMYSAEVSNEDLNIEEQGKPAIYAKDENGDPYSPSWATLNFKASYAISDYIQLIAGVENITDVRYRPYSSGLVAPGRNTVMAVKFNF
jgi:hemoglobin/transferrin/lactoferrin receptor protein